MTFLGLEQPVAYGRQQVFDPTTAQMVLNANRDYINAVYRDYQQAMADMKEFNEKYGDFTSPIQADMDWYYNNVTGRVKNFINDLYARGIDPLRSQEGRAAIARELATMPTKGIAQVRQSAETVKEYIKTMGALAAQGKYNADLERMAGRDLSTWNTMGDPENGIKASGVWGYSSPTEYKDLNEFTGHIFDKMQDEYIGTEGGYDYLGVSRDRRANALTSQIGGIMNSDLGRFHYAQSKAALENRLGRPVSDAEAMQAFKNDILSSTTEYERRNRTENKEYARQRDFYYDNKLDAAKKARDYYYDILPYADTNGDGKLSQEERAAYAKAKQQSLRGGGEKDPRTMNVFREAEAYARTTSDLYGTNNIAGVHATFAKNNTFGEGVDPVLNADRIVLKDSNKISTDAFKFNAKDIYRSTMKNGTIFTVTDNGEVHPLSWQKKGDTKTFTFLPDGNMRSVWDGSGYKYYISGTMKDDKGNIVSVDGKDIWIQVKEGENGQIKKKK